MNLVDIVWMRRTRRFDPRRFIEIDLLRGLAILLMIFGHILWDLDYFGVIPMNNGIYTVLQQTVPALFFVLVGMSLMISMKKKNLTPEEEKKYHEKLIIKGLKVFNLGMFLSIMSMIALPDRPVFFGVLHCIGLSIVLSVVFLRFRACNIVFAGLILFSWPVISSINFVNPTIVHFVLGFRPADVFSHTIDYFPLIPWFGVVLVGMVLGDCLYCGDKRRFRMPDLSKYRPAKLFSWVGQHSLEIYLLHQPVIAGTLYVFLRVL